MHCEYPAGGVDQPSLVGVQQQQHQRPPPPDEHGHAGNNGDSSPVGTHLAQAQYKIDQLKTWGVSTYKCTKQAIAERFGKSTRTVNDDLERKVDLLRELQQRYSHLLVLSKSLIVHMKQVQSSHLRLAEQFAQLASRDPDVESELLESSNMLRGISGNSHQVIAALEFFASGIDTLANTSIEDTMATVRNCENARLEYDAYRCDLEALKRSTVRSPDFVLKLTELEAQCQKHQAKYDQLRAVVEAKMTMLSSNKLRVLKKLLSLFSGAIHAYYSGNRRALDSVLKQYSVRSRLPTGVKQ